MELHPAVAGKYDITTHRAAARRELPTENLGTTPWPPTRSGHIDLARRAAFLVTESLLETRSIVAAPWARATADWHTTCAVGECVCCSAVVRDE